MPRSDSGSSALSFPLAVTLDSGLQPQPLLLRGYVAGPFRGGLSASMLSIMANAPNSSESSNVPAAANWRTNFQLMPPHPE